MSVEKEAATAAGEFTVSDKMYEISEATNKDGSVDVEITGYKEVGDEDAVNVYFKTPTRKSQTEKMPWPKQDSAEYKFVRICRNTVGGLNGAKFLKIDGAEITADPETWEINAPEKVTPRALLNRLWKSVKMTFHVLMSTSFVFVALYGFGTYFWSFPAVPVHPAIYFVIFILSFAFSMLYMDVVFSGENS